MMDCFITFRSVTFAQHGQSVLENSGIRCQLHRTPRWMEEQGCGYCLRLQRGDALHAAALLRGKQVRFRKIYLTQPDGSIEESRI